MQYLMRLVAIACILTAGNWVECKENEKSKFEQGKLSEFIHKQIVSRNSNEPVDIVTSGTKHGISDTIYTSQTQWKKDSKTGREFQESSGFVVNTDGSTAPLRIKSSRYRFNSGGLKLPSGS